MSEWTQDDVAKLKAMWSEGATASQISVALGGRMSRSAVLGKLHRLGLRRGPCPAEPPVPGASEPRASAPMNAKPRPDHRPAADGPDRSDTGRGGESELCGREIWELREGQCRWPIGPLLDRPKLFCGAPTPPGSAWCLAHREVVYVRHQPAAAIGPQPQAAARRLLRRP